MRYFVAHILSGEAKGFHERLTRELSSYFHTVPLHERIPPHITIKPPFETDDAGIQEVERILRAFATGERATPLRIHDFGRFGFRTIYMDILKSKDAVSLVRRAIKTLNTNISWMPAYPLEGNKLHASVARFLTRRQYRHIWRYLKKLHPEFSSSLNNLTILKKENGTWSIHARIPLRALDEDSGYGPIFDTRFQKKNVLSV